MNNNSKTPTTISLEKKKKIELGFALQFVFLIFLIIFIVIEGHKFKILKSDFKQPYFILNFIIVIIFSFIMYFNPYDLINVSDKHRKDMKKATIHAFIAFMISLFAHLDLIYGSFFLVWYFVYATNDDLEL